MKTQNIARTRPTRFHSAGAEHGSLIPIGGNQSIPGGGGQPKSTAYRALPRGETRGRFRERCTSNYVKSTLLPGLLFLSAICSAMAASAEVCEKWQNIVPHDLNITPLDALVHEGDIYFIRGIVESHARVRNGEFEIILPPLLWDVADGAEMVIHDGYLVAPGTWGRIARLIDTEDPQWEYLTDSVLFTNALTVFQGNLVIGGGFSDIDGTPANNIGSWDGEEWHPIGDGIDDDDAFTPVRAMTVYDGDLIAAGTFSTVAGGEPANNIARWNGQTWAPLGAGITGDEVEVRSLTVHNGYLFAGGRFSEAGGAPANNIARWNGSEWAPVGSGVAASPDLSSRGVYTMTSYGPDLFVGGRFDSAGGVADTQHLAMWSTQPGSGTGTWKSLGSADQRVTASVVHGDSLVVGGSFSSIGGEGITRIARWTAGVPDLDEQPQSQQAQAGDDVVFTVVENPAQDSTPWTYEWRRNGIAITSANTPNAVGYDTATLTLENVSAADFGVYDVAVFNQCGMQISQPAALSVQSGSTGPACPGDLDEDGAVDVFDLLILLDNWGICPE